MKVLNVVEGTPIPESIQESAPSFNKSRRTDYTDSIFSPYQLYFNGLNNLALINIETFSSNEIPNFFTWEGQWCFAMLALVNRKFDKYFGLGYQNEQRATFHYFSNSPDREVEFVSILADEVIPDLAQRKSNFFCGLVY